MKVNDNYEYMCETAEAIRAGYNERGIPTRDGGDRFFMCGQWHYPPALYQHLITCDECSRRAQAKIKTPFDVPAQITITTLMELCAKYDDTQHEHDYVTSGMAVFKFVCDELKKAIPVSASVQPVADLTRESQI